MNPTVTELPAQQQDTVGYVHDGYLVYLCSDNDHVVHVNCDQPPTLSKENDCYTLNFDNASGVRAAQFLVDSIRGWNQNSITVLPAAP